MNFFDSLRSSFPQPAFVSRVVDVSFPQRKLWGSVLDISLVWLIKETSMPRPSFPTLKLLTDLHKCQAVTGSLLASPAPPTFFFFFGEIGFKDSTVTTEQVSSGYWLTTYANSFSNGFRYQQRREDFHLQLMCYRAFSFTRKP